MTDLQLVAIAAIITALFGGVVNIVNAISASNDRKDARRARDEQKADSNILIDKADQIHSLADGNLSKITNQLQVALMKIESLQEAKRVADIVAAKKE